MFCVLFLSLLAIIFVACISDDEFVAHDSSDERVLDFKSMRDVELDVIISLWDSRREVEEILGLPLQIDDHFYGLGHYTLWFSNMMINVFDDTVIQIRVPNQPKGYTIGTTFEQIEAKFGNWSGRHVIENGTRYFYGAYYCKNGEIINVRERGSDDRCIAVESSVAWGLLQPEETISLMVSISIRCECNRCRNARMDGSVWQR